MKRFWAGMLLLGLTGCAGMEEFFYPEEYYEEMTFDVGAPAVPVQAGYISSCPNQIAPAAYHPPSTQEPPLAK
jgi:hypothetical protein